MTENRKKASQVHMRTLFKHIIEEAHKHTFANSLEVRRSKVCGCCYCERVFPVSEISDNDMMVELGHTERTVLCPYCGIDAVFGDASGIVPTPELLEQMCKYYF